MHTSFVQVTYIYMYTRIKRVTYLLGRPSERNKYKRVLSHTNKSCYTYESITNLLIDHLEVMSTHIPRYKSHVYIRVHTYESCHTYESVTNLLIDHLEVMSTHIPWYKSHVYIRVHTYESCHTYESVTNLLIDHLEVMSTHIHRYGVATTCRLLKIMGLFCKRAL